MLAADRIIFYPSALVESVNKNKQMFYSVCSKWFMNSRAVWGDGTGWRLKIT